MAGGITWPRSVGGGIVGALWDLVASALAGYCAWLRLARPDVPRDLHVHVRAASVYGGLSGGDRLTSWAAREAGAGMGRGPRAG